MKQTPNDVQKFEWESTPLRSNTWTLTIKLKNTHRHQPIDRNGGKDSTSINNFVSRFVFTIAFPHGINEWRKILGQVLWKTSCVDYNSLRERSVWLKKVVDAEDIVWSTVTLKRWHGGDQRKCNSLVFHFIFGPKVLLKVQNFEKESWPSTSVVTDDGQHFGKKLTTFPAWTQQLLGSFSSSSISTNW